jgi:hypothetical protein
MHYVPVRMTIECVYENRTLHLACLYFIVRHCTCRSLPEELFVVSGPNPKELGPLLQGTGGRELGNVNHQQMDPCGGGSSPHSTNRGGARTTTMSHPWHLLHAMRAMRIASQDPSTDSADTGDIHLGGQPPGKETDSGFGVSRYLTQCGLLKSSQTIGIGSFLLQSYKIWIKRLTREVPWKGF